MWGGRRMWSSRRGTRSDNTSQSGHAAWASGRLLSSCCVARQPRNQLSRLDSPLTGGRNLYPVASAPAWPECSKGSAVFSIGEFPRIAAGLSIKTLRFHEQGLLTPARVDPETGYRYYDTPQVEKARVIRQLRDMDFSLEEIGQILQGGEEEADLLAFLERQKATLEGRLRRYRAVVASLDTLIRLEKEAMATMRNSSFEVQEKTWTTCSSPAFCMKGRYCSSARASPGSGSNSGGTSQGSLSCCTTTAITRRRTRTSRHLPDPPVEGRGRHLGK